MRVSLLALSLLLWWSSMAAAQPLADIPSFDVIPCPVRTWTETPPSITALPGARLFTERYSGGLFAIEVPSHWNGELVLWAHGNVNPNNPGGDVLRVQIPQLREHWIAGGFAWAASSYRCNGYVAGVGLTDTMALIEQFKALTGRTPKRIYLTGVSLGGRVVVLGLREFPEIFAGGLAQCAVGQETQDVRVAIAAAAEYITGVHPTPQTLQRDLSQMQQVLGRSPDYTDKGRQLASIQIELTGGPRPFALEGLVSRFIDNIRFGLTNTPDTVVRAATNVDVRYSIADGLGLSAADLNQRVPRLPAGRQLRKRDGAYLETAPFDGRLSRPLLMIHGTGDLQVPVSQQQAFKREVVKAGREQWLVQRLMRIPGHCGFSRAEQARAFDDLVTWVRSGQRPDGDEVLGDLSNAGLKFTDPKRPGDPGTRNLAFVPPPNTR
jgi:fermentation-respiration switch protein FrsA (DUF1100 family)